ncbi:MAG: hypothetical protein RDU59_00540 [Thermodesulfobacteriota bacterium]|nr:hypothetical protein [Thermodesulfobacteriota bacterium]
MFRRIPKKMRQTLDVLPQTEMDPYAVWQRGTNENTNSPIRQYRPKGTDFRKITEEYLAFALKKLNHRPRKRLNYRSPLEAFWQTSGGALTI